MSYEVALEAAGAEVVAFGEFGSYQGDWWAKVRYNGEERWIHGYYGSCSGCDAFQAEFDYNSERCYEHRYEYQPLLCESCESAKADYAKRLAEFGRGYLDGNDFTQEEAEKEASTYLEWDHNASDMLSFIKEHAIEKDR